MTWAFLVPLPGGAVHLWAWDIARGRSVSPALARPWQNLLFAGLATVTAGLYYRGIVDIAGVDGSWEYWFLAGGGVLTLAALRVACGESNRKGAVKWGISPMVLSAWSANFCYHLLSTTELMRVLPEYMQADQYGESTI